MNRLAKPPPLHVLEKLKWPIVGRERNGRQTKGDLLLFFSSIVGRVPSRVVFGNGADGGPQMRLGLKRGKGQLDSVGGVASQVELIPIEGEEESDRQNRTGDG